MKMQNFRRLITSDYPEDFKVLVEKLSITINSGFEALYEAINSRKISLRDNILCTVKDVSIIVDAQGIPKNTTVVSKDAGVAGRIDGVSVINANNVDNSTTYPTSGVFVNFASTENGILITHVTGLQADSEYTLRIIIWIS